MKFDLPGRSSAVDWQGKGGRRGETSGEAI